MLGFKILNFNIFGVFQKNEYFLEYEAFVNIFGGSSQNWTIFRGNFYTFWVFYKGQGTEWGIFLGTKISKKMLGCLKYLIFLGGIKGICGD